MARKIDKSTPRLLSNDDLALRWGTKVRNVRRWVKKPPGVKKVRIGGKLVRYPVDSVERFERMHGLPHMAE